MTARASEGFLPGGATGGFSQYFCQGGGKWFLPLEIEKTTFLLIILKSRRDKAPLSDAHA